MKPAIVHAAGLAAALLTLVAGRAADYSGVDFQLEPNLRAELRDWSIGGIAVALVADQPVVYAAGFGEAKRDSVFRCGKSRRPRARDRAGREDPLFRVKPGEALPTESEPFPPAAPSIHLITRPAKP